MGRGTSTILQAQMGETKRPRQASLWAQVKETSERSMSNAEVAPNLHRSQEGAMARQVTLTTLAGEELLIAVDPNAHTCLQSFENAVLAELPHLGSTSTFGCELQFVQAGIPQILADPIQSKLRARRHCSAMFCGGSAQRAPQGKSQVHPSAAG